MDKRYHFEKNSNQSHRASQEVLYSWDSLKQQWVEYATIPVTTPLEPANDIGNRNKRRLPKISKSGANLDFTHIKDNDIFRYVLRVAPGMKQMIAFIQECSPARSGEYDLLLDRLHNKPTDRTVVENRLFEIGLRMALKNALLCSVKHKIDLEDAFQTACIGLLYAIREHNAIEVGSFPVYSKRWINRTMNADLPIYEYNFCLPPQEKERIEKKLRVIETEESDIELVQELSKGDLYEVLKDYTNCNEKEADHIATILTPFDSTEELAENEEADPSTNSDCNAFTLKMIEDIEHKELCNHLEQLFASLENDGKGRIVSILKMRYGFDGIEPMSLEQIGDKFGITRERVRQIETKGVTILKHPLRSSVLSPYEGEASVFSRLKTVSSIHPLKTEGGHNSYPPKTKKSKDNIHLPKGPVSHTKKPQASTRTSSSGGFVPGYKMKEADIQSIRTKAILYDASITMLQLKKQDYLELKEKGIDFISDIVRVPDNVRLLDEQRDEALANAVVSYLLKVESQISKEKKQYTREDFSTSKRKKTGYGGYIPNYEMIGSSIRNKRTGALFFDASITKLSLSKEDRSALKEKRIDMISEIVGLSIGKHFLNDELETRIKNAVLSYLHDIEEKYKE